MTAHLTEGQLWRYFAGEGDNNEATVVEEHILACDACAVIALHVEAAVELRWKVLHRSGGDLNN